MNILDIIQVVIYNSWIYQIFIQYEKVFMRWDNFVHQMQINLSKYFICLSFPFIMVITFTIWIKLIYIYIYFNLYSWLSLLEGTRWLQHMSGLLRAAVTVASAIERDGRPVLVHCSDGWDRTPQIVALAQILLDPYYRTMEVCQRYFFLSCY